MSAPHVRWSHPTSRMPGHEGLGAPPLLVLLHGYGADETDVLGLAGQLPSEFALASVRASGVAGPGYAWFPLSVEQCALPPNKRLSFQLEHVRDATEELAQWLDTIRGGYRSLTLLGFSQGMAMASSLARHRPEQFAAVVGLSGFVIDAADRPELFEGFFHDERLAERRIPFFWGRDQADPVIPQAQIEFSSTWLSGHTALTKVLYANMWHGICAAEMQHVAEFLRTTVLTPAC